MISGPPSCGTIETAGQRKYFPVITDWREGYLEAEGPWGTFRAGRFGAGIEHRPGTVTFPGNALEHPQAHRGRRVFTSAEGGSGRNDDRARIARIGVPTDDESRSNS